MILPAVAARQDVSGGADVPAHGTRAGDAPIGGVASVRRAIDLLLVFSREDADLPLSELARRANLEAATAHRLVMTLVDAGLLAQSRTRGAYRLGSRLMDLGFAVLDQIEVRRVAFPYLVAFHGQTHPRSASSLLVPDRREMLNVERLPPREWGLLFTPQLGRRFAMHSSAAGRAYLAALPDDERRAILRERPLERWTPRTEVDPDRLEEELRATEARGFGVSDEEAIWGSRAVAAAIRDASGRPVATLLAQASSVELSLEAMIEVIAPRLTGTAAQISASLGHDPQRRASHPGPSPVGGGEEFSSGSKAGLRPAIRRRGAPPRDLRR